MSTDTATSVGQTLSGGRYQIVAKLGEGGMGLVYRALDRRLDTEVVIKVPRRTMLNDPAFAGRFAREIRSLVQLVHPHIVKVMDVGEHGGVPFAVMQYLPGGTLRDRQGTGPGGEPRPAPSPEDLRSWLEPVADALDFIHRKNYIHRDVKPDNILFDGEGHAYLSDFGVAKVLAQQGGRKKNTALTGAGMILGTPHFMAPELIMGQPSDGRADQYALGVVVYELLSGRYPFDGATPVAIYLQHTNEEPVPLESALPGVPEGLASAVRKALAKEPGERYPDCASFARAALAAFDSAVVPQQAPAAGTAVTLVCPGCRRPFARPVTAEPVRCPSCGKALQVSRNGKRPDTKPRAGTGTVAASRTPPVTMPGNVPQVPKTTSHGSPPSVAKLVPPAQEIISTHGQSRPERRPAARRLWPWLVMCVTGCLLTGLLLSGLTLTGKPPVAVEVASKQARREPPVAKPTTTGGENKSSPPTETTGSPEETPADVVDRPSPVTPPAPAEPQLPVAEPKTLPPPTTGADRASHPTEKAGKPEETPGEGVKHPPVKPPPAAESPRPVQSQPADFSGSKRFRFRDEKEIDRDWTLNKGNSSWQIEGEGLRLYLGTVLESKFLVSGDLHLEINYDLLPRCEIWMTIWGQRFEFKADGSKVASLHRTGKTVVFGSGSERPTTLKLKSSQEALSTPITIRLDGLNLYRPKMELLVKSIAVSKTPLTPDQKRSGGRKPTALATGPEAPPVPPMGNKPTEETGGVPAITPALLQKKFHGRAAYNPRTKELTLTYDFRDKSQLKDFDLGDAKPALKGGAVVLEPGESIKHLVHFKDTLTLTGVLHPKRHTGTHLGTSEGIKVTVRDFAGTRILIDEKEFAANGNCPNSKYAWPMELKVLPSRVAVKLADVSLGKEAKDTPVGQVQFFSGDAGNAFGRITMTGKLDPEWAKGFFAK
jgi:LSD1 subclass zinc finger protein